MALGYNENEASGLIVWNMKNFNHPGGDALIPPRCNGIYCTWFDDSASHRGFATNTNTLYEQLHKFGAVAIGRLAKMDCEGKSNV